MQLYAGLLQFLQFCRGSKLSGCAPVVLEAVVEGWAGSGAATAAGGAQGACLIFKSGGGGVVKVLLCHHVVDGPTLFWD